ncbi:MAG: MamI family restriction endonuclease [Rhodospirillaceae bacterium]|nr:MamI family restriction endonuclease [Rhodospirillaceae bacterium]MYB15023.1 MamI family restriction endonuclease [Rhodospirillaceae bacterium]
MGYLAARQPSMPDLGCAPKKDLEFRKMCQRWYLARANGTIVSTNFQLHPPRRKDTNIIRNSYGILSYPLLLCAENRGSGYSIVTFDTSVMTLGECTSAE